MIEKVMYLALLVIWRVTQLDVKILTILMVQSKD